MRQTPFHGERQWKTTTDRGVGFLKGLSSATLWIPLLQALNHRTRGHGVSQQICS